MCGFSHTYPLSGFAHVVVMDEFYLQHVKRDSRETSRFDLAVKG